MRQEMLLRTPNPLSAFREGQGTRLGSNYNPLLSLLRSLWSNLAKGSGYTSLNPWDCSRL